MHTVLLVGVTVLREEIIARYQRLHDQACDALMKLETEARKEARETYRILDNATKASCIVLMKLHQQVVGYFHLRTWVPPVAALCVVLMYYVERAYVWWKYGV